MSLAKIGEWKERTLTRGFLSQFTMRLAPGIYLEVRRFIDKDQWVVFMAGVIDGFIERDVDAALRRALVAAGQRRRLANAAVKRLTR